MKKVSKKRENQAKCGVDPMKLGMLGINQILRLRRCLQKERISIFDVKTIYNFSDKRIHYADSNRKALVVLEKLEIYGLISKVSDMVPWFWTRTDEGKLFLDEKLPQHHNRYIEG